MSTIAENLDKIRDRITKSLQQCHRPKDSVKLLAVSKTKPIEAIIEAYEKGQRDFGENYLQESLEKIAKLKQLEKICWHFIGPIQSNKTRAIAENFSWVHSVDRVKIAKRLSEQRPAHLPDLNLCLQVNISDEKSKSGVKPHELGELLHQITELSKIQVRGLMAIPLATDDPLAQHQAFAKLRQGLQQLQKDFPSQPLDTLSMGMSSDLEAAIDEGATWIRIGSAIFGKRA